MILSDLNVYVETPKRSHNTRPSEFRLLRMAFAFLVLPYCPILAFLEQSLAAWPFTHTPLKSATRARTGRQGGKKTPNGKIV